MASYKAKALNTCCEATGRVEQFLEQVARRGSWFGGGSASALSTALSAALLEKLTPSSTMRRRLSRIRRACVPLIERDAILFARVIEAMQAEHRGDFERALKAATDVPCQVFEHAHAIQAACRTAARTISRKFQADVTCARALAVAAGAGARALIETNLAWLKDANYTKQIQRRLRSAQQHASSGSHE